jgi:hypothetical protein
MSDFSEVAADSSPAGSSDDFAGGNDSNSDSNVDENQGLSLRERATKHFSRADKSEARKSGSETDPLSEDETDAQNADSQSAKDGKDKVVDTKTESAAIQKMQGRISAITGKYKEAAVQLQSVQSELVKREKAIDILHKEVQRLSGQVREDPRDAKLRQLETEREVEKFLSEYQPNDLISAEYEKDIQVQERVDGLIGEVKGLAETYYMVSPQEILLQMQQTGQTAETIAKSIHQDRLNRSRKAAPAAPRTVGATGDSNREIKSTGNLRDDMTAHFNRALKSRG